MLAVPVELVLVLTVVPPLVVELEELEETPLLLRYWLHMVVAVMEGVL